MFPGRQPSSRPYAAAVPSKGALRVLYQLAYASAGTAVGIATLCAEERRRRTAVVQKIADNARKIRESPRYVGGGGGRKRGSKARGKAKESEVGNEGMRGDEREETAEEKEERWWRPKTHDLPSEVAKGYDQVAEGGTKRNRSQKRSPHHDIMRLKPSESGMDSTSTAPEQGESAVQTADHEPVDQSHGNVEVSPTAASGSRTPRDTVFRAYRKGLGSHLLPWDFQPVKHPPIRIAAGDRADLPASLSKYRSRNDVQSGTLREDLELFFNTADRLTLTMTHLKVASGLLRHALEYGTLSDIRSLVLWMMARQMITPQTVTKVCVASRTLGDRISHQELVEFYRDFFWIDRVRRLPRRDRFEAVLTVLSEALKWEDVAMTDVRELFDPSLDEMIPRGVFKMELMLDLEGELEKMCDRLLVLGKPDHALRLVMFVSKARPGRNIIKETLRPIRNRLFWPALGSRHFDCCALILRRILSELPGSTEESERKACLHMFEQFIVKCSENRARHAIARILPTSQTGNKQLGLKQVISALSCEAKIEFALCCVGEEELQHWVFDSLYEEIPLSRRGRIDEARTSERLRSIWKATHNLDFVREEYLSARAFAEGLYDSALMLKLNIALVEVCNSANRTDLALEMLPRLKDDGSPNMHLLSVTALSLAKKSRWDQLQALLDYISKIKNVEQNPGSTRSWNNVIRIYSREHAAVQTWDFVTRLIEHLKLVPNAATVIIVLESLVSNRATTLIPKWLRFMRTLDADFRLDAQAAATLLRKYYVEFRPPHELIMWFSKKLADVFPTSDTSPFVNLVKESIAYDLRNARPSLVLRAQSNLQLVESARGEIPRPVPRPQAKYYQELSRLDSSQVDPKEVQMEEELRDPQAHYPFHHASNDGTPCEVLPDLTNPKAGSETDWSFPPNVVDPRQNKKGGTQDLLGRYGTDEPDGGIVDVNDGQVVADHEPSSQSTRSDPGSLEIDEADGSDEEMGNLWSRWMTNEPLETRFQADETIPMQGGFSDLPPAEEDLAISPATLVNWSDLRSSYAHTSPQAAGDPVVEEVQDDVSELRSSIVQNSPCSDAVVRNMVLALSLRDYEKVLEIYRTSLSCNGLPVSLMALEIAVQASLDLNGGNSTQAQRLMEDAHKAGMNTSCAMGPILIFQLKGLDKSAQRDVSTLRTSVSEYYRSNDENGWPVKHFLGVSAANVLIDRHCAIDGVKLLVDLYNSSRAKRLPLDLAAMSVFVKGYTALRSVHGLHWVFSLVLEKDMRVDWRFIEAVRRACYRFEKDGGGTTNVSAWLRRRLAFFQELRKKQRVDATRLGRKLVDTIIYSVEEAARPRLDASLKPELEEMFFGKLDPLVPAHGHDTHESHHHWTSPSPSETALQKAYARLAVDIRFDRRSHGRTRRVLRPTWSRRWNLQYRAFYSRELTIDGKSATFRYAVEPDGAYKDFLKKTSATDGKRAALHWHEYHKSRNRMKLDTLVTPKPSFLEEKRITAQKSRTDEGAKSVLALNSRDAPVTKSESTQENPLVESSKPATPMAPFRPAMGLSPAVEEPTVAQEPQIKSRVIFQPILHDDQSTRVRRANDGKSPKMMPAQRMIKKKHLGEPHRKQGFAKEQPVLEDPVMEKTSVDGQKLMQWYEPAEDEKAAKETEHMKVKPTVKEKQAVGERKRPVAVGNSLLGMEKAAEEKETSYVSDN